MVIGHDLPIGMQPGPAPEPALTAAGVDGLPICAQCGHAELFAVQPRARCLSADSPFAGRTVFAGQPACSAMTPSGDDLTLARCGIVRALKRGRDARTMSAV